MGLWMGRVDSVPRSSTYTSSLGCVSASSMNCSRESSADPEDADARYAPSSRNVRSPMENEAVPEYPTTRLNRAGSG